MSYDYTPRKPESNLANWAYQEFRRISNNLLRRTPHIAEVTAPSSAAASVRVQIDVDETGNTLDFTVTYSDGSQKSGSVTLV